MTKSTFPEYVICEITEDGHPRSSCLSSLVVNRYISLETALEAVRLFSSESHHTYQRQYGAFTLEPVK